MRTAPRIPIRRIVRGPDHYSLKPVERPEYPISRSIEDLLSRPTWSVRSLLPPATAAAATVANSTSKNTSGQSATAAAAAAAAGSTVTPESTDDDEITTTKLHHLLRLSALPLPKTAEEESKMLRTLRDQIHFVRAIQSVDTTSVEPLITIRDETAEAIEEETVTLEKMMPYLELEEKVGPNGTVRRRDVVRTPEDDRRERATWEVDVSDLGVGSEMRRRGRFFYVKRATNKDKERVGKKD